MKPVYSFVDFFIHESRFNEPRVLRKARIFVRACLLTAPFSIAYVVLSSMYGFAEGVYIMSFNAIVCVALPFFARTRVPIIWLCHIFLLLAGSTVISMTYLTGGLWSSVFLWIIAIPVVALLIVNRLAAIIWSLISLGSMIGFGWLALQKSNLPDAAENTTIYVTVVAGLLLIILGISLVFEFIMTKALKEVESKNETIADQAAKLEELIEEKDYIIQILSHDLRNPLGNIAALSNLVQTEQNQQEVKSYLEMIARAANNANNLVSRVLEMDISDQKDVKTELVNLNIVELIEVVMSDSREAAAKKNITLLVKNNSSAKAVVADRTCLTQVLQNLVSNAIKFSPVDTQVQAVLSDSEESMLVRIMDEGPGVNPEEESKLFKKFSKLSARPTAGESSAGLGLSLVKRYAELTGAKVWYERNDGAGSTFVVEIPKARD